MCIRDRCERAKVSKDTVFNWKHKNPSSVNTLMAIQNIKWDNSPDKNPWEMFFGEILEDSCRKAFDAGWDHHASHHGGQDTEIESFEDWYEKLVKSSK